MGNASWYYIGPDGYMLTGWHTIGGKQYYLNEEGGSMYGACLLEGITPDGNRVDSSGAKIQE